MVYLVTTLHPPASMGLALNERRNFKGGGGGGGGGGGV